MTVRFDLTENFITEDERLEFVKWFDDSLKNDENFTVGSRTKGRMNTRDVGKTNKPVNFPDVAYVIFDRISKKYKSTKGENGILAISIPNGFDTWPHIDGDKRITFNIVIQSSEQGGELFLDGVERSTPEKALHCYNPFLHTHEVKEVRGSRNRYVMVYRLNFPFEEWEEVEWFFNQPNT